MIKDFIKRKRINDANILAYKRKRSNVEKRLEKEFLDHGIATIPCKVSGIEDIISSYSVLGHESLDSGFVEYLNSNIELIPEEYPIVLNIVGQKFTEKEQEVIKETIESDVAYDLGEAEKENKNLLKMKVTMVVGTIITGIIIAIFDRWDAISTEIQYIFFWFFAYTLIEFIFLEGRDLKKQRLRAARRACISVVFSEEYDEEEYSDKEAMEFIDELHKQSN